jgi:pyruvate dehydrogenase E1 component beta subunit
MNTAAKPKKINFSQAVNMAIDEAMALDPSVIMLGEDVADREGGGVFKTSAGLSTKYGDRVRSTPIAEQAIMGAAVGAAVAGMRPIAEIMLMNFITVAMDQLVNHAAKLRFMSGGQTSVPLTVVTVTGAGAGTGGQHADMYEAWLAHVPGLKVATASNPADAKGLLLSCILDDDPCVFISNSPTLWTTGPAPEPGYRVPLGKANVVREGSDVTLIGYGRAIMDALPVAAKLADQGISVEVVDLRTIMPMDIDTMVRSAAKTRRVVVVHEAVKSFGVGAEIAARLQEKLFGQLLAPIQRIGAAHTPVPFAKPLENAYLYSAQDIEAAICATLNYNK